MYMCVHECICGCTGVCVYRCVCVCACVCTGLYVCVHVCMYRFVYVCMCVYVCVVHVCMYMYLHALFPGILLFHAWLALVCFSTAVDYVTTICIK